MNSPSPGSQAWRQMIAGRTRVLQIIVIALMTGICAFGAFVIFTGKAQEPPQGQILSYLAVGMGAMAAVMHVVIPAIIERAALANQSVDVSPESLLAALQTRTIVACALLEGPALLSLIAVLIEHHPWVLGVTGVLLILMALQIPSTTRVEHWLEARMMERNARSQ